MTIKQDKIGSSVPKQYVTPAELMFLVADHHANAGGDPVVKFQEIPETFEQEQIEPLQRDLTKLEKQLDALDKLDLTDEIREKRERSFRTRIDTLRDKLQLWQHRASMRQLTPQKERARLAGFYGSKRIGAFYPGPIPNLPETFEEARQTGVNTSSPVEKFQGEHFLTEGPSA